MHMVCINIHVRMYVPASFHYKTARILVSAIGICRMEAIQLSVLGSLTFIVLKHSGYA